MLLLVAVVLGVTACGGSSGIEELEGQMTEVFFSELAVELVDISCPEGVQIEPSNQFVCTAAVTDGVGRLRVGVLIDSDGRANFSRENALVNLDKIEAEVAEELSRGVGSAITIECGVEKVLMSEVGGTFACTAVAATGEQRGVEITVDDLDATTRWRLLAV